jgi:thiamine biosynthesis protein ThiI
MKVLVLISGGIDSPVAAYLMIQKGFKVEYVHFDNQPFTDEVPREKAIQLAKHLKQFGGGNTFYIIHHGLTQTEILKSLERKYTCIFCRRFMYRIGERLAEFIGAEALVTGENLGQVASQTLHNLRAESEAIRIPIIRPLIGFDKQEIVDLAKKIGTYEISIIRSLCCTVTPRYPETRAILDKIKREEGKLEINDIIDLRLKEMESLDI